MDLKKILAYVLLCLLSVTINSSFAYTPLWTQSGARLRLVSSVADKNINWVFLPGGPGLGSEYLEPFVNTLKLKGNMWLLDLPGDGSNRLNREINYDNWPNDLTEAVASLPNVILVAHSFAGMLTLSSPGLEKHLLGLILIDTAPSNKWMTESADLAKKMNLPNVAVLAQYYKDHHNDAGFKHVALSSGVYFFPEDKTLYKQGLSLLDNLPYNHLPYDWATTKFDPNYNAKWVPQKIPVLIIAGSKDILTPINIFKADKRFERNNIKIIIVPNAAHFSWIGHEKELKDVIKNFMMQITHTDSNAY